MFITLAVGLYTSRVVLSVLGVTDFGIYNVVGGVVTLLAFLNSSLSGATSRFLTFEIGKGDQIQLNKTFTTALTIHVGLAVIMLVILETLGLWFVSTKLTIPAERLETALVVYHFSVATCLLGIIQLPFTADLLSHEYMGPYAYICIFDVFIKLLFVILLQYINYDKLMLYGLLMMIVTLLSTTLFIIYTRANFEEVKLRLKVFRDIFKPILTFSGWDLYGNFSVVIRSQGLNILQNVFFGPVINAATGISNQVMTAIMGFAENFMVAVKPQIVKYYAASDIDSFCNLINNSSKYCSLLLFYISLPVMMETDFILGLWLKEVPDYAPVFCQLAIVNNWVSIMFRPIVFGIHATGNAKRISIINGTIYIIVLPLSYILLMMGGSPIVPFVLNIVLLFIGHSLFSLRTLKIYVPEFSIYSFFRMSSIKFLHICVFSSIIPILIHITMDSGWQRFAINMIVCFVISGLLIYVIGLDSATRKKVNSYIKNRGIKNKI
jgi:O-antigen/teichoic acid export membrane protein